MSSQENYRPRVHLVSGVSTLVGAFFTIYAGTYVLIGRENNGLFKESSWEFIARSLSDGDYFFDPLDKSQPLLQAFFESFIDNAPVWFLIGALFTTAFGTATSYFSPPQRDKKLTT